MGGVGHRELRMSSSNCCNLYWEQTTSGVSEQDAGTESDSSTGDVYPLSERRRRTASGGEAQVVKAHLQSDPAGSAPLKTDNMLQ